MAKIDLGAINSQHKKHHHYLLNYNPAVKSNLHPHRHRAALGLQAASMRRRAAPHWVLAIVLLAVRLEWVAAECCARAPFGSPPTRSRLTLVIDRVGVITAFCCRRTVVAACR